MTTPLKLTGQRFGRLVAQKRAPSKNGKSYWECLCDCGSTAIVVGFDLKRKSGTRSCGCLSVELFITRNKSRSNVSTDKKLEHQSWRSMMARCYRKDNASYSQYGARGITVCQEWHDFQVFYEDIGVRPEGKTLDRINNELGYSKINCRWATNKEQCRNTRSNVWMTHEGSTRILTDWAKDYGLRVDTLSRRLKRGWDISKALNTPLGRNCRIRA